jgi:hypothetical protein
VASDIGAFLFGCGKANSYAQGCGKGASATPGGADGRLVDVLKQCIAVCCAQRTLAHDDCLT